jgi:hypothetical protein
MLDHEADPDCSDRRFELCNSRALFFRCELSEHCCPFPLSSFSFAATLASIAVFFSLLSLSLWAFFLLWSSLK